ncbi:FliM/FliN family flagellar motor switch protein [Sulfitobacter pacificus]|uniref:FliM/FliN family flagellar motor switch protein n=1 Tax=Sulfitobacter pacificus TaxID=1499314 RepID=UPI00310603BE
MLENDDVADQSETAKKPDTAIDPATDPKTETDAPNAGKNLDAIFGVKLDVRAVLGRSRIPISELLNLTKGSVIELDRRVGEPVDLMINDRLVARGDLVRVKGDMLGVALREIVKDFVTDS